MAKSMLKHVSKQYGKPTSLYMYGLNFIFYFTCKTICVVYFLKDCVNITFLYMSAYKFAFHLDLASEIKFP